VTCAFSPGGAGHDSAGNGESPRGNRQLLRSQLQERKAGLGRGCADLRATALDCRAGVRAALIGREVGIEPDGPELIHAEVEFFGGNLEQRRRGALSQFRESNVKGCGVVRVYGNPGVYEFRVRRTRDRLPEIGIEMTLPVERGTQRKAYKKAPSRLQKTAPLELVHAEPFDIIPAAFWIALRILGYVPQRQM
jgi:hypothetical protein